MSRACTFRATLGRLALAIAVCAAVLSLPARLPARATAPAFRDVPPSYWAYNAIEDLAGRGIVSGVGEDMFLPGSPLTRAQFAALLARAEGWRNVPGPAFSDVPAGSWFAPAVTAAAGEDVIYGTGPGVFSPGAPVTMAEAAVMLARTLGLNHVAGDEARAPLPFSDASSVPSWAHGAVAVIAQLGLSVNDGGAFGPGGDVTRADAAVMIDRLLKLDPAQVAAEGDRAAASVHLLVDRIEPGPGSDVTVRAYVHDASGYIIPATLRWTVAGDGTLSASSTVSTGGSPASDTTPASKVTLRVGGPGHVRITAAVPGGPSGEIGLEVVAPSGLDLSTSTDLVSVGHPVRLSVQVVDASGNPDLGDSGHAIDFRIKGPAGGVDSLTAHDTSGVASTSWTPAAAGSYSVVASEGSLTGGPAKLLAVSGAPYALGLSAASTSVAPGVPFSVDAQVTDAAGKPVGADVPLALSAGPGLSLGSGSAYLSGGSGTLSGITGASPGQATLTATVPGGAVRPATLTFQVSALGELAAQPAAADSAGKPAELTFETVGADGRPTAVADGARLAVRVTDPAGHHPPELETTIRGSRATLTVKPRIAGTWKYTAELPGYADSRPLRLQVQPGPVTRLVVDPLPTSILLPGQRATVRAWLGDAYGNVAGTRLTLASTRISGDGRLSAAPATAAGPAATFTAGAPGVSVVRFSSPDHPSLAPVSVTFRTVANVAAKVSGKGMWLLFPTWRDGSDATLLSKARAAGVTHLYLEVQTSRDGFYGARALDNLLRRAHDDGIAVVSWVYPYLDNPAADEAAARQVVAYRTPDGSIADGLAADIEEQLAPAAVSAYARAAHRALQAAGPYAGPFVGVVMPPAAYRAYPYASLAPYVDVWAPMDYWHVEERDYTYADVYAWVRSGMSAIAAAAGRNDIPFDPILQAYNALGLPIWNPSARELAAAEAAAVKGGAIGVSYYRWGTADAAQWAFIAGTPAPGGTSVPAAGG